MHLFKSSSMVKCTHDCISFVFGSLLNRCMKYPTLVPLKMPDLRSAKVHAMLKVQCCEWHLPVLFYSKVPFCLKYLVGCKYFK